MKLLAPDRSVEAGRIYFSETDQERIAYGRHKPRVVWPNNAAVAVNFCIAYEEGGERSLLSGDERGESLSGTWSDGPQQRDLAAESIFEYAHSGEEAVPLVGHVFPDTAPSTLSATIDRYRTARLWRETARVSLDQMQWDRILCENGLLREAGRLASIPVLEETE